MSQYVNYIVGTVVVALLVAMLWFRGEAIKASADLKALQTSYDTLKAVNADNLQTINRITAMRAADDALLAGLARDVAAINKAAADQTAAIQDLERSNETVRDYLAIPVPDDLRRLLNAAP